MPEQQAGKILDQPAGKTHDQPAGKIHDQQAGKILHHHAGGKNAARILLREGRTLSIPVAGGAHQLKRRDIDLDRVLLSDHGKWRQEHLATFSALYGKTPLFPHLYPLLEKAYRNSEAPGYTLGSFNRALHKIADDFLDIDNLRFSLQQLVIENPQRANALKNEISAKINPEISIFDALFRLGKITVFAFI